MKRTQDFEKHYRRLRTEGILRSVISGAVLGLGLAFLLLFLYWMLGLGGIAIALVAGAVTGAVSGILLYRFKYRPTERAVARRIDRCGLEERMITMLELEGRDTPMAHLQRRDAEAHLGELSVDSVRFNISHLSVILCSVLFVFSLCFTFLGALAQRGMMPYGYELILGEADGDAEVVYLAGEGGTLFGDTRQSVELGGRTEAVLAVAQDGYIFVGWDDGLDSPERSESAVRRDIRLTALFEKIDSGADPEDEEDAASDLPVGTASGGSGGGSSDETGGENPESGGEGQGGGKWQDKNQFIDGATYYRDYLDIYYQYAMGIFEDGEIPETRLSSYRAIYKVLKDKNKYN